MALPTLKISSPNALGRDTRVWLDGHDVTNGLVGVTVDLPLNGLDANRAELRFIVDRIDIDAETLAALQAHVEATSGVKAVDLRGFGEAA